MSWLLRQAEDILNRVDQQTNAAFHQHPSQISLKQSSVELIPDSSSFTPSLPVEQPIVNRIPVTRPAITPIRRIKKNDESDLISYLNGSTSINHNETKQLIPIQFSSNKTRTNSSSSAHSDESSLVSSHNNKKELVVNIPSVDESITNNSDKQLIATLQAQIQTLTRDKIHYESELHSYKRQQIQYQHQIAESDALLRDLRSRESDSIEVLSAKDSQIALLRGRLAESDDSLKRHISQYEELQNEYSRTLEDSSNIQSSSLSLEFLQTRKTQLEQELERFLNENERLNNENEQLMEQLKLTEKRLNDEHLQLYEQQQQTKHAKILINQLEYEMDEYKSKAQRILQMKDKLIAKLKDFIQQRSSTPTTGDQNELEIIGVNDDSTLVDISLVGNSSVSSNWASIQNEELKSENELFKQELQARELTIHTLRNELQEAESTIQNSDEQYQAQINRLNEQLKEERSRLSLAEQDYRKLKQESTLINEDFHKQKQAYQGQSNEREREIERLRLQVTAKTMNQVKDDELEKRLQTLTESLIHKQSIIETLQTDKSSLTMQLERLEKRLDDYDTITAKHSFQQTSRNLPTTSISIDDSEHYENLRYRMPLLRETPYDVDLTKKVKRAANELDKLGIRFTMFLRRYPSVRLGVLLYALILHLWTVFLLFTYTPEVHSHTDSMNLKGKL
ncbi:unnamed protein product [Rotaria socialis]|uniref:Golgin-84 n=1 Tax=Rotaria socialis TaxID=392032 RepID=A0A818XIS0_9BILA|nr:unnamed protein product [Rotaria socialis]CAF4534639.1 unnamed protein product [Rotaria socialis]